MKNIKTIPGFWLVLCLGVLVNPPSGWSLDLLEYAPIDRNNLTARSQDHLSRFEAKNTVEIVELVKVNVEALDNDIIPLALNLGSDHVVSVYFREEHETGIRSVFGLLEDQTSIFFTIDGRWMISRFFDGETAVGIMPLEDNIHMLIRYNEEANYHVCGNQIRGNDRAEPPVQATTKNDNGCKVRIMVAYSDDAVANIPGNLHIHAQSALDESNASFNLSGIGIRFELATVRVFNMVEDPTVNGSGRSNDLQRFFDNDPPFGNVNIYRGNYRSDMQILIVDQDIDNGTGTLFGQVISVGVNAGNAYAICTLSGINDGRFSFTHELGHIMGARHENHGSNYNRGYVFDDEGTNRLRTIMARTGASACNQANSCRVQYWSNPDITIGGDAIGVEDDFDNARWLNEQANNVRNYRENWNNVTINPETLGNNVLGNYSANTSITTSGAVVVNNGGNLNFRAGSSVNLNNGFTVNNGARFGVVLGNCNANVPRSPLLPDRDEPVAGDTKENPLQQPLHLNKLSISPNPMSDLANVEFELSGEVRVRVWVSDLSGRILSELENGVLTQGRHSIEISNHELKPGMYLLTLATDNYLETEKMVVVGQREKP